MMVLHGVWISLVHGGRHDDLPPPPSPPPPPPYRRCNPTKKGTGASSISAMAKGMTGMKAPCQMKGKRRLVKASATGVNRE